MSETDTFASSFGGIVTYGFYSPLLFDTHFKQKKDPRFKIKRTHEQPLRRSRNAHTIHVSHESYVFPTLRSDARQRIFQIKQNESQERQALLAHEKLYKDSSGGLFRTVQQEARGSPWG